MLYKFSKLKSKLDELGFPEVELGSGFQLIKGVNFEKAFKDGNISFENDGVYLEYQDKKYRGYMFIDYYYVSYNGQPPKFPKFHLVECGTIRSFITAGRFDKRYIWSNADRNDVTDIQSERKYKDVVLELCDNCRKMLTRATNEQVNYTTQFHDLLDNLETESELVEVDIFGYVKGNERISRAYRKKKKYQCENCGIKPKVIMDRRWWHTHHINGDKTNNEDSNLECLCVLCHSNKDEIHQQNFSAKRMQIEVEHFKKKYMRALKRKKKPYI